MMINVKLAKQYGLEVNYDETLLYMGNDESFPFKFTIDDTK